MYLHSLRQLDKNIAAAIAGVSASSSNMTQPLTSNPNTNSMRSSFNPNNRLSFINRPFGTASSSSFHQNLNNISSQFADNYLMETRAFPYDRLSQARLTSINSNKQLNVVPTSIQQLQHQMHNVNATPVNTNNNSNFKANSSCKIYQDLDEFKTHGEDLKSHLHEFKGHLV